MVPPLTAEVEMDSPGQDSQDSGSDSDRFAERLRGDSGAFAGDFSPPSDEAAQNAANLRELTTHELRKPKSRASSTSFKPGHPKPPNSGRKPGQSSQRVVETREFCRGVVDDPTYRAGLRRRLQEGTASPAIEQLVWAYAVGKPPDKLELSGPGGSPLQLDDGALRSRLALLLGPAPGVEVIDVTPRQLTAGDQEGEEDSETAVSDDQG